MKRQLLLIIAILLCISLTACRDNVNIYIDGSSNTMTGSVANGDDEVQLDADADDTQESVTSDGDSTQKNDGETDKGDADKGDDKKPSDNNSNGDKKPTGSSDGNDNPDTPEVKEYTVTFDSNGGSEVPAVKTSSGKVAAPAAPNRTGYKFLGWCKQGSDTAWDFAQTLSGDITLIAKWEFIEFTVTFNSNGGSAVAPANTSGGKAIKPAKSPDRAGYKFLGWYKQESDTAWDFAQTLSGDITLIAKWEIVEYTVTFDSDGGDEIEPMRTQNHRVSEPNTPKKGDDQFLGWYKQGSNTAWDFTKEIFEDITLVAWWKIGGDHGPIIWS